MRERTVGHKNSLLDTFFQALVTIKLDVSWSRNTVFISVSDYEAVRLGWDVISIKPARGKIYWDVVIFCLGMQLLIMIMSLSFVYDFHAISSSKAVCHDVLCNNSCLSNHWIKHFLVCTLGWTWLSETTCFKTSSTRKSKTCKLTIFTSLRSSLLNETWQQTTSVATQLRTCCHAREFIKISRARWPISIWDPNDATSPKMLLELKSWLLFFKGDNIQQTQILWLFNVCTVLVTFECSLIYRCGNSHMYFSWDTYCSISQMIFVVPTRT